MRTKKLQGEERNVAKAVCVATLCLHYHEGKFQLLTAVCVQSNLTALNYVDGAIANVDL